MFIPDMPNIPPQNVPVMIAQSNQAQPSDVTTTRTLGVCYPVPSNYYSGENTLSPIVSAATYLLVYEHQKVQKIGTITVLQQPTHGTLRLVTEADRGTLFAGTHGPMDPTAAAGFYAYLPEKGYLGKDKAVMLVDIGGIKVKVVYFFQGVEGPLGSYGENEYCGEKTIWKISSTLDANGNNTITSVEYQSPTIDAWATLSSSILSTLSVDASLITLNIADLPGGAVGQTVGTTINNRGQTTFSAK